jgi:hypothetical protein
VTKQIPSGAWNIVYRALKHCRSLKWKALLIVLKTVRAVRDAFAHWAEGFKASEIDTLTVYLWVRRLDCRLKWIDSYEFYLPIFISVAELEPEPQEAEILTGAEILAAAKPEPEWSFGSGSLAPGQTKLKKKS